MPKMAKKRFRQQQNNTELPVVCAWCNKPIAEGQPVSALGAKATLWIDVVANRGAVIDMEIRSINRTVPVIITAEDSDAAKEGEDLMFMVCSTDCGLRLQETLAKDLASAKKH